MRLATAPLITMMSAFVAPVFIAARRAPRSSSRRSCSPRASRDDELIDDATSEVYLRNMAQQNDGALGPPPDASPSAANARAPPPPPPRARVPPPPPRPSPPRPPRPPRESREPPPLDVPRPQKQYFSPERMERWDADGVLSAPNGLAEGPPDLLQELLPLLAKEEQRDARKLTDEELELKDRVDACWNLYASTHKNSERLDNLRPFRLKDEAERVCERCGGEGMAQCEYCLGEGFVDLGENAEKFEEEFKGNTFTLPKLVTGNIYHCPLCGGLREERCIECFGSGVMRDSEERQEGEAAEDVGDAAWHTFDYDELLRKEADRIEIGLDGTIVMRAKKHKRTGRRGRKDKEDMAEEVLAELKDKEKKAEELLAELKEKETAQEIIAELNEKEKAKTEREGGTMKRKRGRPKKSAVGMSKNINVRESGPAPTKQAFAQPNERPPSSTDFLNTTDYKIGRRLSKQANQRNQQTPATPSSTDMKDNAGNKKSGKRKKKGP